MLYEVITFVEQPGNFPHAHPVQGERHPRPLVVDQVAESGGHVEVVAAADVHLERDGLPEERVIVLLRQEVPPLPADGPLGTSLEPVEAARRPDVEPRITSYNVCYTKLLRIRFRRRLG